MAWVGLEISQAEGYTDGTKHASNDDIHLFSTRVDDNARANGKDTRIHTRKRGTYTAPLSIKIASVSAHSVSNRVDLPKVYPNPL